MAELGDEDEFPNDYDGLDFDNIPGLQGPTISTPGASTPSVSSDVAAMDSTFLAAVDALEARALGEMARDGHLTDAKTFHSSRDEGTGSQNMVHDFPSRPVSPMKRKGKRKAESQEDTDIRAILAGYETELTCPICCDLLVGAQVANPCGHTYCGECGYGWLSQNAYEPTCAVCRSSLSVRKPLLPNFAVDNFVRQHLQALMSSGRPEWQEKGYRTIEWNKRVESWKRQADARAAKEKLKSTRQQRRQPLYYNAENDTYTHGWVTVEGTEDDEVFIPRVMTRRGTRSRH